MAKYIAKRLLSAAAVMVLVSLLTFIALDLIPGNAAIVALGTETSAQAVSRLTEQMGLDRPLGQRLADYYIDLLHFDLGTSSYFGQDVMLLISQRISVTFPLAFLSVLIALIAALILGSAAALRKGGIIDSLSRSLVQLASSVPSFWLSLIFLIFFSSVLGLADVGQYTAPSVSFSAWLGSIFLPVAVLAVSELGSLLRMVRSSMINALSQDWYANALIRGVSRFRAVMVYALRYALPGPLTMAGGQLAKLLGGTAIVESVFALPGLGRLFLTAVEMRDLALVQGIVIFVAFFIVLMNLITDLVLFAVNPDIGQEARGGRS